LPRLIGNRWLVALNSADSPLASVTTPARDSMDESRNDTPGIGRTIASVASITPPRLATV
jgi:hypothetical protein